MECKQPGVTTPVDFQGEDLNIMVDVFSGKVWVCIDGVSVFRAKVTGNVTMEGHPIKPITED